MEGKVNKWLWLLLLASITQFVMAGDLGKQLVTEGNAKGATACATCHGADGEGNAQAGYPMLAGLNASYLAKQLRDFANKSRQKSTMQPIASALSEKEIKAVTVYYADLEPAATEKSADDSEMMKKGEHLAKRGNWAEGVPACFTCHGPGASGVGSTFPRLRGQHATYIEKQLQAWKSGNRKNDPNGLMNSVAAGLDQSEIRAVSAYLSSLSPVTH